MKVVESLGSFHYEINGKNEADEKAAVEYLENALNLLSHTSINFDADWQDAQESCRRKFNVTIKVHE